VRVEAWFAIARGLVEGAAVLEIGGDPGRPEAVVAKLGFAAGRPRRATIYTKMTP
jgi:hypothetical protein